MNIIDYNTYRLEYLAAGNKKIRVAPIFSNEGPTNTQDIPFMGTWLETHSQDQAFKTWMDGYNALNASWKANIEITGAQWFLYNNFMDINKTSHITNHPISLTACAGDTKTFSVASSTTNKNYYWMKNGRCLSDGGNISGSRTATLRIANITNADAATYYCRVSSADANNPSSFASNNATLSISTSCNVAPTVSITAPVNGTAYTAPANITLAANATDSDGSIAKVEFFNGTTLLYSDNVAPYSYAWSNVPTGTYAITAKATDNAGAVTTSSVVNVTVNVPITQTPYGGTAATIPGTIQAENFDLGGQGFAYNETTPINQGAAYRTTEAVDIEPTTGGGVNVGYVVANEWLEYTVNVAAGIYKIDARVAAITAGKSFRLELDGATIATFSVPNTGGWQTWQTINVNNVSLSAGQNVLRVFAISGDFNLDNLLFTPVVANQAPTITLTAPTNGTSYVAPGSITISANASDADGSVSKVEFYSGATLLHSDVTAPYSYSWQAVAAGSYTITAKATDNMGASTTAAPATVSVSNPVDNQAPSITLTSPSNGTTFNAPANISLTANASDNVGVVRVEFFNGTTLIGNDVTPPYSFDWSGVAAGSYSITAKAFDAAGNASSSTATNIVVNTVTNNGCSGIPQYVENGGYSAGTKIQISGTQYQCKPWPYSGWCNGAAWAYAPGSGLYWADAWTVVGSCGANAALKQREEVSELITNFPNPFAQQTSLNILVANEGHVSIIVYNKNGQAIQTIVDQFLTSGNYQYTFDAAGLNPDIYFVKMNLTSEVVTHKIFKIE